MPPQQTVASISSGTAGDSEAMEEIRIRQGREATHMAAVIDSQSAKRRSGAMTRASGSSTTSRRLRAGDRVFGPHAELGRSPSAAAAAR